VFVGNAFAGHGSCEFPGSKNVSNKTKEVVNSTHTSNAGEKLR
ncbi:glucan endo-13-beta-glucosidase, partial [Trifolium pratense]